MKDKKKKRGSRQEESLTVEEDFSEAGDEAGPGAVNYDDVRVPVVALVGRPNVGKSTLFNRLTGRAISLVHETAHTTRDVKSGVWEVNKGGWLLFDTCGMGSTDSRAVQDAQIKSREIVAQSDFIVLVVSGRDGWTAADAELLEEMRLSNRPFCIAVNKVDSVEAIPDASFYESGEELFAVSGLHGHGLLELEDRIEREIEPVPVPYIEPSKETTLSIVGRPNVGKSTLFNRLLGEQRSVVSPEAGTTVDVVEESLVIGGLSCRLVDTAGARRQVRVKESLEQAAVSLSLEAIRRSHYVVLMIDAEEGVTHQDIKLMQYAWERSRSLILIANRVDLSPKGEDWKKKIHTDLERQIPQMLDVPMIALSALTGERAHKLLPLLEGIIEENRRQIPTRAINDWLQKIQTIHPPKLLHTGAHRQRRRPRFFYAVQVRTEPVTIRIFCNFPGLLEESYQRYISRSFKETFDLPRVPVGFQFQRGREDR